MRILALTGSIGMGKSTTAAMFSARGVAVFDSDACVHRLYNGRAAPVIEARFPGAAPDGKVDRARLAAYVLKDRAALADLEALVHPMVAAEKAAFLNQQSRLGRRRALLDVPLLFETGGDREADLTIVVSAQASVQKQRVLARPGMTEAKFLQIIQRQLPDAEKRRRGHYVIETDRGLAAADRQVGDLLRALCGG